MKTIKILSASLLFSFFVLSATSAVAADNDPSQQLRETLLEMLKSPNLDTEVNEMVRVSFFITTDGEIVVLKTDSRTKILDEFIKARLNYKTADIQGVEANRIYNLKVQFDLK